MKDMKTIILFFEALWDWITRKPFFDDSDMYEDSDDMYREIQHEELDEEIKREKEKALKEYIKQLVELQKKSNQGEHLNRMITIKGENKARDNYKIR